MARPQKLNADYFSHDADMRNDPRVKALRVRYGLEGYAVWCMMLEVLTDSDYFKRSFDDVEAELTSADFGISVEKFKEMLDYMVNIKLLQKSDDDEFLSQKLHERLISVIEKREKSRFRFQSASETTQKKRKETKRKETKKNKPKAMLCFEIPDCLRHEDFQEAWGRWVAYRKEITGAAASEKELKMLMESMFNEDLGPEAFQATFNSFVGKIRANMAENMRLRGQGVGTNMEGTRNPQIDDDPMGLF